MANETTNQRHETAPRGVIQPIISGVSFLCLLCWFGGGSVVVVKPSEIIYFHLDHEEIPQVPAMIDLINFTACSRSSKRAQTTIIHASFEKNKNLAMMGITQKSLFMTEKCLFWYHNVHGRQVK